MRTLLSFLRRFLWELYDGKQATSFVNSGYAFLVLVFGHYKSCTVHVHVPKNIKCEPGHYYLAKFRFPFYGAPGSSPTVPNTPQILCIRATHFLWSFFTPPFSATPNSSLSSLLLFVFILNQPGFLFPGSFVVEFLGTSNLPGRLNLANRFPVVGTFVWNRYTVTAPVFRYPGRLFVGCWNGQVSTEASISLQSCSNKFISRVLCLQPYSIVEELQQRVPCFQPVFDCRGIAAIYPVD